MLKLELVAVGHTIVQCDSLAVTSIHGLRLNLNAFCKGEANVSGVHFTMVSYHQTA